MNPFPTLAALAAGFAIIAGGNIALAEVAHSAPGSTYKPRPPVTHIGTNDLPIRRFHDTPGIETTRHGVVLSSTLPHCQVEQGGPEFPCTWNIGDAPDGNGRGLAYVVPRLNVYDYVWPSNPVGHGWHWVRLGKDAPYASDCLVKQGKQFERCPDGHHDLGH